MRLHQPGLYGLSPKYSNSKGNNNNNSKQDKIIKIIHDHIKRTIRRNPHHKQVQPPIDHNKNRGLHIGTTKMNPSQINQIQIIRIELIGFIG